MRRRHAIALAAMLVAVPLAGCIPGPDDATIRDSYTSEYDYHLSVKPDGTLTNVTLLLPLPVENGSSVVADKILLGQNMSQQERRDGFAFDGRLPDWNYTVAETAHGPMLAIRTDEIPAEFSTPQPVDPETGEKLPVPEDEDPVPKTYSLSVRVVSDERIRTATALDHEPVLRPKLNLSRTRTDCDTEASPELECYTYDSRFMLSYDANASTEVDVGVTFDGSNGWFTGGWTGNDYHDFTNAIVRGSQDGWVAARGEFDQGSGNYLPDRLRWNVSPEGRSQGGSDGRLDGSSG
jgi:hypothetical protein